MWTQVYQNIAVHATLNQSQLLERLHAMRKLSILLFVITASISFAGQSYSKQQVSGIWKGAMTADQSKLNFEEKKQFKLIEAEMAKIRFNLNLKADGKFVVNVSDGKKNQVVTGVWKLVKKDLITIDQVRDGKSIEKAKQREDKLKILSLKNNKMVLSLPDAPPWATLVVSR